MANKKVNNVVEPSEEAMVTTQAFFEKHLWTIIITVVVILAVIAGFFLYRSKIAAPREAKASTALSISQELFANEDYEGAIEGFEKVSADFSGTKAANLAKLYAGLCYANTGNWDKAVAALEKYSVADDAMIGPAAIAALADAYANTGNVDKAIATLKKAAATADKRAIDGINYSISATFLMKAGVLLESQGKDAEALALYKDIKAKYVNAQQVQSHEVDKYIYRLQEK